MPRMVRPLIASFLSASFVGLVVGVGVHVRAQAPVTTVINDPPVAPHSVLAFPARDFVSTTGFEVAGGPYTFNVIRNGVVVGTATGQMPVSDGAGGTIMEVNHPGGGCWEVVTPSISPGDIVRITNAAGVADQTTVANVFAERPVMEAGVFVVHGTAQDGAGNPLPIGEIEQRMISSSAIPFPINGKRSIRAPGEGLVAYDPISVDNPVGIRWTARYPALGAADIAVGLAAESRILWLGRNPGALLEVTIFENDPTTVVKGPQAPCTAPSGLPPLTMSATPRGGVYNAQQFVTLAANDPAAAIFYTLDGSNPADPANLARLTYTIPVPVFAADGTVVTLKAVAVVTDPAGVNPPVTTSPTTEAYGFDTVAPAVAATPIGGAFATTQIVSLTASEPSTIFFTTNLTDPSVASNLTRVTYVGPLTISAATTLMFVARDPAGNLSGVGTEVYTIDTTPPAVPSVPDLEPASDNGASNTDNRTTITVPQFSGTAEPGATVRLLVDAVPNGSAVTPATGLYLLPVAAPLSVGDHSIRAQAIDAAGNLSAASAALAVTILAPSAGDTTAPVAVAPARTIVNHVTLTTTSVPVAISWSATDVGTGVAAYELEQSVDGGATWTPVTLPTPLTKSITPALAPSSTTVYAYRVRARDNAGNIGAFATGVPFHVMAAQESDPAIAYAGSWPIAARANAFGGSTSATSGAGSTATYSFTGNYITWVTEKDRTHGQVQVWLDGVNVATVDNFNAGPLPRRVMFAQAVSQGAHTIQIRTLATKNPSATGTRTDIDAFVVLDTGGTPPPPPPPPTGDTTPPISVAPARSIVNHSTLTTTAVPVTLAWSATDAGSGVARYALEESLNGGTTWTPVALPTATTTTIVRNLTPSATTQFQYRVRATDVAGNVGAFATATPFKVLAAQENDAAIAYVGGWPIAARANAFGGSTSANSTAGSTATYAFTGSYITWVTEKNPAHGQAEVWIDGVKVVTIDNFNAGTLTRRVMFAQALAPGTHTIRIRTLATKSAAATGTRTDIDAFIALQ